MIDPADTIDTEELDVLNAAWDDWNVADPTSIGDARQSHALFRALESADLLPDPDSAFLAGLRSQLVVPRAIPTSSVVPKSAIGLVAYPQTTLIFPRSYSARFLVAAVAAALIIAALFGGSRWIPGSDSAGFVASAMASPATHDVATSTTYPVSSSNSDVAEAAPIVSTHSRMVLQPTAIPNSSVSIPYETFGDR